jgi:hypothetical protein
MNKDWDEMQMALRSGYVITLRELDMAPGRFCLDPVHDHPSFVRNAIPGIFKEDEIKRFLNFMGVKYRLLPAKNPDNN